MKNRTILVTGANRGIFLRDGDLLTKISASGEFFRDKKRIDW